MTESKREIYADVSFRSFTPAVARTDNRFVGVEQVEIPPVEEGQEAAAENDRGLVEMDGVDEIHHTSPKTELPEDGGDDDLFGFFRMQPLEDEASAERDVGEKPKNRPPHRLPIKPGNVGIEERGEKTFG